MVDLSHPTNPSPPPSNPEVVDRALLSLDLFNDKFRPAFQRALNPRATPRGLHDTALHSAVWVDDAVYVIPTRPLPTRPRPRACQ